MKNFIIRTPGTYDELDIRCPNCNSHEITIIIDEKGYFYVTYCSNCNFKAKYPFKEL